jgi:hypothetical protein
MFVSSGWILPHAMASTLALEAGSVDVSHEMF